MKYQEIKEQRRADTNKLFSDLGVFWAFSNSQFAEGMKKSPLKEGEKYVSLGAGGYMPKHNAEALQDGMKAIEKTFKAQIKEAKAREEHILYELNNHEICYTGDITETLNALGSDYTADEVNAVLKANKTKLYANI